MKKLVTISLFSFLCITVFVPLVEAQDKPVRIIYDSDMGPMIDDVAAIAVLHALEAKGEAKILATIGNNRYPGVASVFDVFNTYYGDPNIPIGLPNPLKGPVVRIKSAYKIGIRGGWQKQLVKKFPQDVHSNDDVPSAVEIYRKVLSKQPNHSVTIVSVGFLTNLSNLLTSGPDQYSKLTGKELVKKKVDKLVAMAGTFTGSDAGPWGPYKEYNLYKDALSSKHVFKEWPTEVIFVGFQLGLKMEIGYPIISNDKIKKNPVKYVYKMEIDKNVMSFDPIAALVGVRGAEHYFNLIPGHITVQWDGTNGWDSTAAGQYYLKPRPHSISKVSNVINKLIQYVPILQR